MKIRAKMPQSVLCFVFLLVTRLDVANQSELHTEGDNGLKRAVVVHGATQVSYGNFAVDKFHRLEVSLGSSSIVRTYRECAISCVNTPPCNSFNVASSADLGGNFLCELLNEDKYRRPEQLVNSQQFHHYSIKVCIITPIHYLAFVKFKIKNYLSCLFNEC